MIALWLLFILSILLTIAIGLITSGQLLINYMVNHGIIKDHITILLFTIGKWLVIVLLFFMANSFLYYLAPAKKTTWRFISAGSTLATVLSVFTFVGFSFYINHFGRYNKLYGSIGTLLVIMVLMYLISLILLVGFELNASIHEAAKQSKKETQLPQSTRL
jgi:membrane protein